MKFKDYYKILGVSKNATLKEITDAYTDKMLECGRLQFFHDPFKDGILEVDPFELLEEANEALNILTDPEKRTLFDKNYDLMPRI